MDSGQESGFVKKRVQVLRVLVDSGYPNLNLPATNWYTTVFFDAV